MELSEGIISRRSIRKFKTTPVSKEILDKIVECGRWTPSGVNFQPWKIYVITNRDIKEKIANCSKYSKIINEAPHSLAIFLDQRKDYSYVKYVQSIGALFQNLLLSIHANGLGGVWIGEIYNQKEEVHNALEIDDPLLEFMGLISFGYPNEEGKSTRKSVDEIVKWLD